MNTGDLHDSEGEGERPANEVHEPSKAPISAELDNQVAASGAPIVPPLSNSQRRGDPGTAPRFALPTRSEALPRSASAVRPYPNLAEHRPSIHHTVNRPTADPRRQTLGKHTRQVGHASPGSSAPLTESPNQGRGPQDGLVFGKYLIIRLLAKGGASEIYEAMHLGLKKPFALKVLRADLVAQTYSPQDFLREGENAARVHHPHIVDVTDLGLVNQVPYLVMELLRGRDLATLFADRGPMPTEELVDLLLPVVAAVAAGHHQGIVHGDLKPGNVFLHEEGHRIIPKVLDFGLSCRMHEHRHPSGSEVFGTPHYMAPEQARGTSRADARTDQYAIGVMLFEGVTGQLPHDAEDVDDLLHRIAHEEYCRPAELVELPAGLDALIARVLSPERGSRFTTVADLGLALCPYASAAVGAYWFQELGGNAREGAGALEQTQQEAPPRLRGPLPPPPAGRLRIPGGTGAFSSAPPPTSAWVAGPQSSSVSPQHTQTGDASHQGSLVPSRRRLPWIAAGAVAVSTLGVLAAYALMDSDESSSEPKTLPVRVQKSARLPIKVTAEPHVAELLLDGQKVGVGSFAGEVDADGSQHALVARAPGYESKRVNFRGAPPPETIVLEPLVVHTQQDEGAASGKPTGQATRGKKRAISAQERRSRRQSGMRNGQAATRKGRDETQSAQAVPGLDEPNGAERLGERSVQPATEPAIQLIDEREPNVRLVGAE